MEVHWCVFKSVKQTRRGRKGVGKLEEKTAEAEVQVL